MKKIMLSIAIFMASLQFVAQVSAMYTETIMVEGNRFTTGDFKLQLSTTDSDADGVADSHNINWNTIPTAVWTTPANWAPGQSVSNTIFVRSAGNIDIPNFTVRIMDNGTVGNHEVKDYIRLTKAWYDQNGDGVVDEEEDLIPQLLQQYNSNSDNNLTLSEILQNSSSIALEKNGSVLPGSLTNNAIGGYSGTGKGLLLEWELMHTFPIELGGSLVNIKMRFDAVQI
jgi:hypothetical protein